MVGGFLLAAFSVVKLVLELMLSLPHWESPRPASTSKRYFRARWVLGLGPLRCAVIRVHGILVIVRQQLLADGIFAFHRRAGIIGLLLTMVLV